MLQVMHICSKINRFLVYVGVCGWAIFAVGCSTTPTPHGQVKGDSFSMNELLQSDSNRFATLAMQENIESLMLLADKLYQRNPSQWRKTAASRQEALSHIRSAILERKPWAALQGLRDVQALSLALQIDFTGDRVAAFTWAMGDMLVTSHGGNTRFTLIDGINAQHVYNAARNVEIANWILNTRKNSHGQPLLLSNHLSDGVTNLSFEREIGKMIARLDLLAIYSTESVRRAAIGWGQSLVGGPLLQFFPVQ